MTPQPLVCSCCRKRIGLTFAESVTETVCWSCLKGFGDWLGSHGFVQDSDAHPWTALLALGLGTSGGGKVWLKSPDGDGFRGFSLSISLTD